MALIEQTQPDFLYSLHNSSFGGVYFYISGEAPPLYDPLHKLVASQGLPLHLGEPEIPYIPEYARAIYKVPVRSEMYDFYEKQTGTDPAEIMKGGTSSFDFALSLCDPFCLVCEMPYFFNPAIHDTSPSDMVRRDAILQGLEQAKKDLNLLQGQYEAVKTSLTVPSPFRDAIEDRLRTFTQRLAAQENWAKTDPKTAETATVAEKFDNLVVKRFGRLLGLGLFVRLLDAQMAADGGAQSLSAAHERAVAAFEERSAELEGKLDYTVIPIQKLVRVQLGSALLAADHAKRRA